MLQERLGASEATADVSSKAPVGAPSKAQQGSAQQAGHSSPKRGLTALGSQHKDRAVLGILAAAASQRDIRHAP